MAKPLLLLITLFLTSCINQPTIEDSVAIDNFEIWADGYNEGYKQARCDLVNSECPKDLFKGVSNE